MSQRRPRSTSRTSPGRKRLHLVCNNGKTADVNLDDIPEKRTTSATATASQRPHPHHDTTAATVSRDIALAEISSTRQRPSAAARRSRRSRRAAAPARARRGTTPAPRRGPARPRRPAPSPSSSRGDRVLVVERRREHRRVVGVDRHRHAGGDERRQRVLGQRRHRPGADVRGRAHLERDRRRRAGARAAAGRAAAAMPCPIRSAPRWVSASQIVSGPVDSPACGTLCRPAASAACEVRRELLARHPDLRAAETEADQPVRTLPQWRRPG